MIYKVGDVLKAKVKKNILPRVIQLKAKDETYAFLWIDTEGCYYSEDYLDEWFRPATTEELVVAKLEGLI